MAMSVTVTSDSQVHAGRTVSKITLDWVSAADGSADKTFTLPAGELACVVFDPGSPAPTANYDVVINDANGVDILAAQGANKHETTATRIVPGVPFKDGTTTSVAKCLVYGEHTLAITNAGDSKAGSIVLYIN